MDSPDQIITIHRTKTLFQLILDIINNFNNLKQLKDVSATLKYWLFSKHGKYARTDYIILNRLL